MRTIVAPILAALLVLAGAAASMRAAPALDAALAEVGPEHGAAARRALALLDLPPAEGADALAALAPALPAALRAGPIAEIPRAPDERAALLRALAASAPEGAPVALVERAPSASLAHALAEVARLNGAAVPAEHVAALLPPLDATTEGALLRLADAHVLQWEATRVAVQGTAPDLPALAAVREHVARAALDAAGTLRDAPRVVLVKQCSLGFILDLAATPTAHDCNVSFSVDLGGADTYTNNAGGAASFSNRFAAMAIDLGRDADSYSTPTLAFTCVNGGAELASGFLLDEGGADRFERVSVHGCINGGSFQGSGVLVSLGDDVDLYHGEGRDSGGVNGGTYGGLGFLFDAGGADRYGGVVPTGGIAGGAYSTGSGAQIDLAGDDHHHGNVTTGGALGGAYGARGLLLDVAGDDTYGGVVGEAGGLAGAARVGVGTLVDLAGANTFAFAAVPEGASLGGAQGGADFVCLAGVCPDYAAYGLLVTGSGSDDVSATGLAVGAGDKGGFSVAVDLGGANEFTAASGAFALGFGRDRGVGILLDRGAATAFALADGAAGLGAGILGVGALLRPDETSTATYDAAPLELRGTRGAGIGLLVDRGVLAAAAPEIACAQPVKRVEQGDADGDKILVALLCTPEDGDEQPIHNPVTGERVPDLPKPTCGGTLSPGGSGCSDVAPLVFDERQRGWLDDPVFTSTTYGATLYVSTRAPGSDVPLQQVAFHASGADRTCHMSCVILDMAP